MPKEKRKASERSGAHGPHTQCGQEHGGVQQKVIGSSLARPQYRDGALFGGFGVASLLTYGAGEDWKSRELAMMCMDKGFYWADPAAWTPERVKAAGIALEKVYEEVRKVVAKERYTALKNA